MFKLKIWKFNFIWVGLILFMVFTIINTSQFGASLSWMIIPCFLVLCGMIKNHIVLKESTLILLFWMVCVISTIFSRYVSVQRDSITFIFFCVVYILIVSVDYTSKQILILNRLYILVASICSIDILYNWITHNFYSEWFQRASFQFMGIYKDPNYVMAFIVPAIYLNFLRIIWGKKVRYVLIEILMLSNFITTGSRGAMLSFGFSIFITFLIGSKIELRKRIKMLFIIVLAIVAGLILINEFLPSQSIDRLFHSETDSRIDLWSSALDVFFDNPILGGGMGSASKMSLANAGNYSHNVYIDILANSGIVGILIFGIFFYRNCCRTKKKNVFFLIGAITSFMLPLFFINGFNTATFYLPLIILTIYSHLCRKKGFDIQNILIE